MSPNAKKREAAKAPLFLHLETLESEVVVLLTATATAVTGAAFSATATAAGRALLLGGSAGAAGTEKLAQESERVSSFGTLEATERIVVAEQAERVESGGERADVHIVNLLVR